MIVISSSVVLSATQAETVDARNPRICYHNVVRADNVFADEQTDDEPAVNVANPATYLLWRGETTAEQSIAVNLNSAVEVNYFAIAKHNLGSSGAAVVFQSSTDGATWTDVTSPQVLSSDNVLIHEFDLVFASYFRLLITPGSEPPAIAVLYIGRTLVLQRRIYVGHTPLPFGRKTTISSGRSESGQFLGRVMRREFLETSVDLQNLTPMWYREYLDPFFQAARTDAFFWSWRPQQYPDESGYAWLTSDPKVSNQRPNGMMQASFSMQGLR